MRLVARRQDLPLWGMLFGVWLVAYFALLGFESTASPALLRKAWVLTATICGFVTTPLVVRRYFVWTLARPRLAARGQVIRGKLAPVHPAVESYVRDRASSFGIPGELRLYRIPKSARQTNAYVWSAGTVNHLALSSKAEYLFGCGRRGDQAKLLQFQVLIDHELGHLWHQDALLFLLARAVVASTVLLTPVKLLLLYVFYTSWTHAMLDFSRIIPALTDGGGVYATSGLFYPSQIAIQIAYLTYSGASVLTLIVLLRLMKRRRELLADQFAIVHAQDATAARLALRELLRHPSGRRVPSVSFRGALNSHPSVEVRLARARRSSGHGFSDWEAALVIVVCLVVARTLLGSASAAYAFDRFGGLKIVSIFYVAVSVLLVVTYLDCDGLSGRALLQTWSVRTLCLVGLGILAGAFLSEFDMILRWLSPGPLSATEALLARIERRETLCLIWSLPIVLGVFAVAYLIACGVIQEQRVGHIGLRGALQAVAVAGLSTLLLWLTSLSLRPALLAARDRDGERIRQQLYELIDRHSACLSTPSNREAGCDEPREAAKQMQAIDLQISVIPFRPPIGWLFLWEQPFRRPALIA